MQKIIDARPTGVRQMFADYGITVDPTPEAIANAYAIFGKPFIGDLVNAVIPRYDSAEGDALQANAAQAGEKKTLFENILAALSGATDLATALATALGKGGSKAADGQQSIIIQQPDSRKSNVWLFAGIGIFAVILLAVIIIIKKK